MLLLKSGTLSLRLFECVPAMIPSAINSRPTTSSWPSNPLSASFAPQIRLWLTIVRVYKLYLLTYLLTYFLTGWQVSRHCYVQCCCRLNLDGVKASCCGGFRLGSGLCQKQWEIKLSSQLIDIDNHVWVFDLCKSRWPWMTLNARNAGLLGAQRSVYASSTEQIVVWLVSLVSLAASGRRARVHGPDRRARDFVPPDSLTSC